MKIVYSTDQVYLHGGVEKVLAQKLNYLVSIPIFEVHLITTEQKGKGYCYPISDKVSHHDLGIDYNRTKSYFSINNFKRVPKHLKLLKEKINEIKPDVLIVCNYAFDFYFIPFIASGIKTIKEFHSSRFYDIKDLSKASFFKRMLYAFNNKIENKYTYIVVLNNDEKNYYKTTNIKVIPNSIKLDTLRNISSRNDIIVSAGRISEVKQFDHLIRAWSLIAHKFPNWEIHIYGEGDALLANKLNILIEELSLTTIKLMGVTNILEEKMQEASIYALTSATECFPMVLLESLACGLPIVSYNCPNGPRNIITAGKDGILVAHNNIEEFSNQLSKLMQNEILRKKMEQHAVKNIERFSEKLIMKQWLDLFNKIKK